MLFKITILCLATSGVATTCEDLKHFYKSVPLADGHVGCCTGGTIDSDHCVAPKHEQDAHADHIALTQTLQKWNYAIDKFTAKMSTDPDMNDYVPLGTIFDFDAGKWLNSVIRPTTKFLGPYMNPSGLKKGNPGMDTLAVDWNALVQENVDLSQPSPIFNGFFGVNTTYYEMGIRDSMGPGEKAMTYYAWYWIVYRQSVATHHILGNTFVEKNDGTTALITAPFQASHLYRGSITGIDPATFAGALDQNSKNDMVFGTYYMECKKEAGEWYISTFLIQLHYSSREPVV